MPQTINTNLVSLNAQRNMNNSQSALATSMQRLSSGLRVNSAKDDAAGLAIADLMNTQIRGNNVAMRNANDAISLNQTAEAALGSVGEIFQRMRELAVQSANGTNSANDRASLNLEFVQLAQEATRSLGGTTFNGQNILADSNAQTFQVSANNNNSNIDRITVNGFNWAGTTTITALLGSLTISGTELPTVQITANTTAQTALTTIDTALGAVNSQRAAYGARQNRLENVIKNLMTNVVTQSAARGRIVDADYAAESASMSRAQILQQAGNAMVAQANQLPQSVLSLLR
jgi:flagellin